MSSAKDAGPILKRCNTKQQQTFFNSGECLCLRHYKHLYSWERITQKIYSPFKIQGKDLTMKQMFDISEKLIAEQSNEMYGVNTK